MVTVMVGASAQLEQMLADMARQATGVDQAVILSSDGLLVAMSPGLTRDDGDRFAAVAAGLLGIAVGASGPLNGGPVEEVVVQMRDKLLLVMRINAETVLAALAPAGCDVATIAYEMAVFARSSAPLLDAAARRDLQAALTR
jgi:predicted regulator of Ras-like GTPase activity (Roadblock/LC7/MglB family)